MKKSSKIIALVSIMSAVAFVLYSFEIPLAFLFPAAPYLKIDFSDVPAVFTGIAIGPIYGIVVQIVKNVLHAIFLTKEPMFSGELGNIFAGILFILPIIVIKRRNRGNKSFILSLFLGTVLMSVAMILVNYFITFPLYGIPKDSAIPLLMTTFVPFNLLKGCLVSLVIYILLPKVTSILQKYV